MAEEPLSQLPPSSFAPLPLEADRRCDWRELNDKLCSIEERLAAIKRDFARRYPELETAARKLPANHANGRECNSYKGKS